MKILYIGEPQTYARYRKGIVPSHWLYGACEMEKDGHAVIWEQERSDWKNDINLMKKYRPDLFFIPNLNLHCHFILLLLTALKIYRKPIYAYLHHSPNGQDGFRFWLYKLLFRGVKHLFFLSERTKNEVIQGGWIVSERCSLPGWGADEKFFSKVLTADKGYFVSTGKENRDFDILIEAFRQTGAPLRIMTAKSHGDYNYEYLMEKTKNIPNIQVVITENTGDVYPRMLKAMAEAKALVCPLRKDCLTYCVGLSTITDAEGLGKPLIITNNPYHEERRVKPFYVVNSVKDWINAIQQIEQGYIKQTERLPFSMQDAYVEMKAVMFD